MYPMQAHHRSTQDISAELAMLGARIHALGNELHAHRCATVPAAAQPAQVPPVQFQPAQFQPQVPPPAPQPAVPAGAPPVPPQQTWRPTPLPPPSFAPKRRAVSSTTVLAWTGGVVTLLGVVLALVLAIQRGYLGPVPRVLGGLVLAGALLGIGARLYARPHGRTGGLTLAATGVAALYLDIVAATALYGFLPDYAGLLAGFAAALAGLWLAARWDSLGFACFVVACCAVAVPVLTGLSLVLPGFLLALLAATVPAALRRGWNVLSVGAAAPALLAMLSVTLGEVTGESHGGNGTPVLALLVTAGFAATAVLLLRRNPADNGALGVLAVAVVPVMLAVPLVSVPLGTSLLGVAVLGMAGLWLSGRRGLLPARGSAIAGIAAGVALGQATLRLLGPSSVAVPLLLEALVLTALAVRLSAKGAWLAGVCFGALGWLFALVYACPPVALLMPTSPEPARALGMAGTAALGTVVAVLVPLAGRQLGTMPEPEVNPAAWLPAVFPVLWGSAATVVGLALAVAPDGFVTGQVVVTIGWVVAGLALLLRRGTDTVWRVTGLTLAAAAVAKLVLFDLAALDGLARVAAALGAGLVLLLAGARYANRTAEATAASTPGEPTPAEPTSAETTPAEPNPGESPTAEPPNPATTTSPTKPV